MEILKSLKIIKNQKNVSRLWTPRYVSKSWLILTNLVSFEAE